MCLNSVKVQQKKNRINFFFFIALAEIDSDVQLNRKWIIVLYLFTFRIYIFYLHATLYHMYDTHTASSSCFSTSFFFFCFVRLIFIKCAHFFFLKKTCFQHRNFSPHFFVHDKECRMYETKHKLLGGAESKSKKKKQILERACFPFFHCTVKWNRKATKKWVAYR